MRFISVISVWCFYAPHLPFYFIDVSSTALVRRHTRLLCQKWIFIELKKWKNRRNDTHIVLFFLIYIILTIVWNFFVFFRLPFCAFSMDLNAYFRDSCPRLPGNFSRRPNNYRLLTQILLWSKPLVAFPRKHCNCWRKHINVRFIYVSRDHKYNGVFWKNECKKSILSY